MVEDLHRRSRAEAGECKYGTEGWHYSVMRSVVLGPGLNDEVD